MRGLAAVMTVRQQHLMQSERARNAIRTCRARSEQWRTGTGVSADTKKLWRPSHNDDTDSAWKDEAVVFRNHPELVRSRAQDGSIWDPTERVFISSRLKQATRLPSPGLRQRNQQHTNKQSTRLKSTTNTRAALTTTTKTSIHVSSSPNKSTKETPEQSQQTATGVSHDALMPSERHLFFQHSGRPTSL